MTRSSPREAAKTLDRGLDVLGAIAATPIGLNVSELSRAAGISRQSVYRAVSVLEAREFIRRQPATGRYLLADRLISLVEQRQNDHGRMSRIRELMMQACAAMMWPVVISAPQGLRILVLETTDRDTPLTLQTFGPGFSVPMLESASGRAYLAHLPARARDTLLDVLAQSHEPYAALARRRGECLELLREARQAGYAVTTHGIVTRAGRTAQSATAGPSGRTTSLSVPVLIGGAPRACVGIRYIDSAMTRATAVRRYLGPLKDLAAKIADVWAERTPVNNEPVGQRPARKLRVAAR